jgi:hypothetical protein
LNATFRVLAVAAGLAALVLLTAVPALGNNEAEVTASVTPQNISVSVSPTSISYGIMGYGESKESATTVVVTNTGTGLQAFDVIGTDASGGAANWTLVTDGSGINNFRHSIRGVTGGNGVAIAEQFVSKVQEGWATKNGAGYTAGQTQHFKARLYMPLSGSGGLGTLMSTKIIIIALSYTP